MAASASGEQFGLASGITLLLIAPTLPGPGILCVPYNVMPLACGSGAHAERPAATNDRANQRYCSFHMIILARTDIR